MIRARRLFLVPSLSMFLLFVPVIGIPLMFISLIIWFSQNQKDIYLYFKGTEYRLDETSKTEDELLK